MIQANRVHSTPPINTSAFQETANPADGIASLKLTGPERETIAALLGFVICGLKCGSNLEQMEAIAFKELERARKLVAKNQRRQFWIAGSRLVSAPVTLA